MEKTNKPKLAPARKKATPPKAIKAKPTFNAVEAQNEDAASIRRVSEGDVIPDQTDAGIENFRVSKSILAAQEGNLSAMADIVAHTQVGEKDDLMESIEAILEGLSPDDVAAVRDLVLKNSNKHDLRNRKLNPDEILAKDWRKGGVDEFRCAKTTTGAKKWANHVALNRPWTKERDIDDEIIKGARL